MASLCSIAWGFVLLVAPIALSQSPSCTTAGIEDVGECQTSSVAALQLGGAKSLHRTAMHLEPTLTDVDRLMSSDGADESIISNANNTGVAVYAFLPEACGRMDDVGRFEKSLQWVKLDKRFYSKRVRADYLTKKADEAGLTKVCLKGAYVKKVSFCYVEVKNPGQDMYWKSCKKFGNGRRRRFCNNKDTSCGSKKTHTFWRDYTGSSCSPSYRNTAAACYLKCSSVEHRTNNKLCDNGMYTLTDAQMNDCGSNAIHNGLKGCFRVRYGRGIIEAKTR